MTIPLKRIFYFLCFLTLAIILNGCGQSLTYEQHITGNYYLVAGDVFEQMTVSRKTANKSNSYTIVIDSTVYNVDWNNDAIVIKQHPSKFGEPVNKTITNYFILLLSSDDIYGPYDKKEHLVKLQSLGIHKNFEFSKKFSSLK